MIRIFVMPAQDEAKLLELARLAPTSFNIQNWRFVNVKDKALREEIKKAAWDQAHVSEASMLIIMCADVKAFEKEPKRYWVNAPKAAQDILVPMIVPFYDGKELLQHGEATPFLWSGGTNDHACGQSNGFMIAAQWLVLIR